MQLRDFGIKVRLAIVVGVVVVVLGIGALLGMYLIVRMGGDVGRVVEATQQARVVAREVDKTGRIDKALKDVQEIAGGTVQTERLGVLMLIIMTGITLVLALLGGRIFGLSINNPIKNLVDVSSKIAEGDLSQEIKVTGKDEVGKLEDAIGKMGSELRERLEIETRKKEELQQQVRDLSALALATAKGDLTLEAPQYDGQMGELSKNLNQMTKSLRQVAEKLVEVTSHLGAASTEIQATSQQQASGATEQAASVSQVTSAINELATNAKQVAEAAASVSQAATDALQSALEGKGAVQETVDEMKEIKDTTSSISQKILALEEKSHEIGSILAIIDDIAEQTNLLALNAAIEAARAGEAGKGFAVVATEIRNLAEDVTSSTKEIAEKITEMQTAINSSVMATEEGSKKVDEGVRTVKEAGEGLEKIISVTEHAAELAKQISGATQQQETASEQVVQTMNEVSEVVRQSAAGSQQSAKSSEDLAKMASELKEMVAIFKLDSGKKVGTKNA